MSPKPPVGQRPLIAEPYCDCAPQENLKKQLMAGLHPEVQRLGCPIGLATTLTMVIAAFVNPVNVLPENQDALRYAARQVADMLEEAARGIRLRVSE